MVNLQQQSGFRQQRALYIIQQFWNEGKKSFKIQKHSVTMNYKGFVYHFEALLQGLAFILYLF